MKVLKGETRIGIGHTGKVLSYEGFPAHLKFRTFGIDVGKILSPLTSRDSWLFKIKNAGVCPKRGYYCPPNYSEF